MTDERPTTNVARLSLTRILRADPDGLGGLLDDPSWLGHVLGATPGRPGLRRVETDLAFGLGDGSGTLAFRKGAFVDLGRRDGAETDGGVGEVAWRAVSMAPLFPVFAGSLAVHDGGLQLDGVYAPPGGGIGLLVDRAILHRVAERTGIWFLDRVIEELRARAPG